MGVVVVDPVGNGGDGGGSGEDGVGGEATPSVATRRGQFVRVQRWPRPLRAACDAASSSATRVKGCCTTVARLASECRSHVLAVGRSAGLLFAQPGIGRSFWG